MRFVATTVETPPVVRARPRLRGVSHQWAFVAAIPAGIALVLATDEPRARTAAAIFAASVVVMFGASALYHRITWTPRRRLWARRLDHVGIYGLIAGTYTPFGLLALSGAWQVTVLAIVWGGTAAAVAVKLFWPSGPKWTAAVAGVALGWVGIAALPQLVENAGVFVTGLALGGGLIYTVGALVYAFRRPDPAPAIFGYHEVFHALVIAAVTLQYVAVAALVAG